MGFRENSGGSKRAYTVTDIQRKRDHVFAVVISYLQECSCSLGSLPHHNGYDQQTWQDGDLSWGAPTHKVTWPFDHVVLGDCVTN